MSKAIELFRKAKEKKNIDIKFNIEYGEAKVPAKLSITDIFRIVEEQDLQYTERYTHFQELGWEDKPIMEAEWQEILSRVDGKQKKALKKPKNLADQKAQKFTQLHTVKKLIPQFLKNPDTDKLLFPTKEEQAEFTDYISSDMNLFNLLLNKFVEAMSRINETGETVKNSSKPENSPSGKQ